MNTEEERLAALAAPVVPMYRRISISNRSGWILVASLIFIQYCLFRTYVTREIVWAYPAASDQASYLSDSYEVLSQMLSQGFWKGLWAGFQFQSPNGVLFLVQYAVIALFFGASRLTALTITFAYFATAEVVMVATIRKVTKSWEWAFCGLGLLALSASRHVSVGGLDDFRIDCLAASLYGICACLLVVSNGFESRRFSLLLGLCCAALIGFRFIAAVYVGILYLAALLAIVIGLRMARSHGRPVWLLRLRHLMLSIVPIILFGGPILATHVTPILGYYWAGHVRSAEKSLRAANEGIHSRLDAITYYPKSVTLTHLGAAYDVMAVLLLVLALYVYLTRRTAKMQHSDSGAKLAGIIAAVAAAIPLLILSVDESKSPIVAGIVVLPFTLALAFFTRELWGPNKRLLLQVFVATILALAIGSEITASSKRSVHSENRWEEANVLRLYDRIIDYSRSAGWTQPHVLVDRLSDYLGARTMRAVIFERDGVFVPIHMTLGVELFEVGREKVLQALSGSEFAIISSAEPGMQGSLVMPFEREMARLQPELLSETKKRMIALDTYQYRGHEFTLFARMTVKATGVSGGWFTADGAGLQLPCSVLKNAKHFSFGGKTIGFEYLKGSPGVHAFLLSDRGETEIPSTVPELREHYTVDLNLSGVQVPDREACPIRLTFDHYFVPDEINHSGDKRKLVVFAPTDFRVD